MSSEALAWAFKQNIKPSSVKFTLVALCECANYQTGRIFPSLAHLSQITGQNRKTIITNIAKLIAGGWLIETGERVGSTGQIKVYQVAIGTVPKAEQSQKRNSSNFDTKESQKRDTKPSREPSSSIYTPPTPPLPEWLPIEAWQGFVEMRKQTKKPMTERAVKRLLGKLEKMREAGQDIEAVLDQSTNACWSDVYEVKGNGNGNYRGGSQPRTSYDKRDGFTRAIDGSLGIG